MLLLIFRQSQESLDVINFSSRKYINIFGGSWNCSEMIGRDSK